MQALTELADHELYRLWAEEKDRAARDELRQRRIFDGEPGSDRDCTPNDYAHGLLVTRAGAGRTSLPGWVGVRKPGVVQGGARWDVRVHRRSARSAPVWEFGARRDDTSGAICVLLADDYSVEAAWRVPWPVIDEYGSGRGRRLRLHAWGDDPRVQPLPL